MNHDHVASPLRLVIDTDTAADDAIALLMAGLSPHAEIVAVTTVAGNVPLDLATRNASWTLGMCGLTDVPIYTGADSPLIKEPVTGQDVHGETGMGSAVPPTSVVPPHAGVAAVELVRLAKAHEKELTLVTLGPLTNIALAVKLDPQFLTRFARVVSMVGAADGRGNITEVAEYNMWADPEAARIVLLADGVVELVGWDASCRFAVIGDAEMERIDSFGTQMSRFVLSLVSELDRYCRVVQGLEGFDLPDPLTMAVAIYPDLIQGVEQRPGSVVVSDEARGQLVLDRRGNGNGGGLHLVREVSRAGFLDTIYAVCAYDEERSSE